MSQSKGRHSFEAPILGDWTQHIIFVFKILGLRFLHGRAHDLERVPDVRTAQPSYRSVAADNHLLNCKLGVLPKTNLLMAAEAARNVGASFSTVSRWSRHQISHIFPRQKPSAGSALVRAQYCFAVPPQLIAFPMRQPDRNSTKHRKKL